MGMRVKRVGLEEAKEVIKRMAPTIAERIHRRIREERYGILDQTCTSIADVVAEIIGVKIYTPEHEELRVACYGTVNRKLMELERELWR